VSSDLDPTFDEIRKGGAILAMIARARISECLEHMDKGDFPEALSRLGEAHGRLQALAQAQQNLGGFASMLIKRGSELVPGDRIYQIGTIETIDPEVKHEGGPDEETIMHILLDDGMRTGTVNAADEVLVVVGDGDGDGD
jgi:hypothetical protein